MRAKTRPAGVQPAEALGIDDVVERPSDTKSQLFAGPRHAARPIAQQRLRGGVGRQLPVPVIKFGKRMLVSRDAALDRFLDGGVGAD